MFSPKGAPGGAWSHPGGASAYHRWAGHERAELLRGRREALDLDPEEVDGSVAGAHDAALAVPHGLAREEDGRERGGRAGFEDGDRDARDVGPGAGRGREGA